MSGKEKNISVSEKSELEAVCPECFTKEQLLGSQRYQDKRDLLQALLESGKKYTISEVNQKIENFMKGKVK